MNKEEFIHSLSVDLPEEEANVIWEWLAEEFGSINNTEESQPKWQSAIEQLNAGRPLQYMLGKGYFFALEIEVDESVLIPRPETEELVYWIKETCTNSRAHVLDLGTGSGCIPFGLKWFLPNLKILGTDVSNAALKLAKNNAERLNYAVDFQVLDLNDKPYRITPEGFDIVVSNPPYIAREEAQEMENHVLNHEPHLALFAPENNPLWFYERILEWAKINLKPNGEIFLEINPLFQDELRKLFESAFETIAFRKDMSGKTRLMRVSNQIVPKA